MNTVEVDDALRGNAKWTKFADKLKQAMTDEYELDGVTVVLRELSAEESKHEDGELLAFHPDRQWFEFAVPAMDDLPSAWKIADRIDHFLNPDPEAK